MTHLTPSRSLGSLCRLQNGRAFRPTDWSDAGLPIVRIQNLNDIEAPFNHFDGDIQDRHLVRNGDVLLSWSGTPGTSFGCFIWNRGPAVLNQHIFKVEVDASAVEKEYFVHAVNSRLGEMIDLSHGGVGLRHITKSKLEQIELPTPPKDKQRSIVSRIRAALVRVREASRLHTAALADANALPASVCGGLCHSGEWPMASVESVVVSTRNGRSIKPGGQESNGRVLTLSAVRDVFLDTQYSKPIVLESSVAADFRINAGEVFVSRSNTRQLVGLASVALADGPASMIYPDLLIKLTPDPNRIRGRYLAFALRIPTSRDQLSSAAQGSSQSMVKISGAALREVKIPVPPLADQDRIIVTMETAYALSTALRSELRSINTEALAHAVIRKLIPGAQSA